MEMLTMGPMPCKVKIEQRAVEFEQPSEYNVFRCGVSSCPEVLAFARWDIEDEEWTLIIKGDYRENGARIYIKSRRALIMDKDHRMRMRSGPGFSLEIAMGYARRMDEATPQLREELLAFLTRRGWNKEFLEKVFCDTDQRNLWLQSLREKVKDEKRARPQEEGVHKSIANLPIVFKCGRCGRLSKIIGAG